MQNFKLTALLALMILCFIACHQNTKGKKDVANMELYAPAQIKLDKVQNEMPVNADSTVVSEDQDKPEENKQKPGINNIAKNNAVAKVDWDKKIVKTANIDLEVKNYNAFNNALHISLQKYGAYISQEEQNQSEYKIENSIVIKVPVDQFDVAMSQLISGNEKLIEKKITAEDVTAEVVDTKSRMEAKKQIRSRYLDLLKQAKNMDEILQVQNEINNIQEEIESASGRIGYLDHSSAFSTINITFYQVLDASAQNIKEPSYLHKLKESFSEGMMLTGNIIIGLISFWPFIALLLIIFVFYKKWKSSKIKTSKL